MEGGKNATIILTLGNEKRHCSFKQTNKQNKPTNTAIKGVDLSELRMLRTATFVLTRSSYSPARLQGQRVLNERKVVIVPIHSQWEIEKRNVTNEQTKQTNTGVYSQ